MSSDDLLRAAVIAIGQMARPDRSSQRERHDFIQRVKQFLHSLLTWPSSEFAPTVYADFFTCLRQQRTEKQAGAFIDEMRTWLTNGPTEQINGLDQQLTGERWYWGSGPCRLTLALLDLLIEHHNLDCQQNVSDAVQQLLVSLGTCMQVASVSSRRPLLAILAIVLDACAELDLVSVNDSCLESLDAHVMQHLVPLIQSFPEHVQLLYELLHRLARRGGSLVAPLGQRVSVAVLDTFHSEMLHLVEPHESFEPPSLDLAGLSQIFDRSLVLISQSDQGATFCETELESRLAELLGMIVGLPSIDSAIADIDDTVAWMYERCLERREPYSDAQV